MAKKVKRFLGRYLQPHDNARQLEVDRVVQAVSISAFPIIRMSVQMHYCKDENLVMLNTIDNAIRKTVHKAAPDAFFYDRPRSWVGDNILNSGKNLD